jgi:hypothetical protein
VLADERVRLPPAIVLDVARVRGGGWVVIEVNPCWASGVYGCDPEAVLEVIRRACVPRARLTDDDRRWLRAPGTVTPAKTSLSPHGPTLDDPAPRRASCDGGGVVRPGE